LSDDLAAVESGSRVLRGRAALRRGAPLARANVLREVAVPVLEPNEYLAALRHSDETLNAECDAGLRRVIAAGAGRFELTRDGVDAASADRTLLLVHGTFSSSQHLLDEFAATDDGRRFLRDALAAYRGRVLMFDHPTLSVSPLINAIDLSRALAGSTGPIDVVAHSRGGLVVRWWLEVLQRTIGDDGMRVVLAGSPLNGTSLAAPNRIQPLLSVLSTVGAFITRTLGVAAAANPFTLASFALLKFFVRRQKDRFGVPPIEEIGTERGAAAAVAIIPGLQGQSAVSNNYELARLRTLAPRQNLSYFALTANFEPERMGLKIWKVLTEFRERGVDGLTDIIFAGNPNDLVVDTGFMTSLADAADITEVHAFRPEDNVHHCNYFRQPETIAALRRWLAIE
jgi:hypothetical protein